MIYATLGTMFLDFARLVRAMDAIAEATNEHVIVQTGLCRVTPVRCEYFDFKPRDEAQRIQRDARVIVCHAGIGSVMDALEARRPFVVVPRLKRFGEHLNDHQLDLAEAVQRRGWGRMVLDIGDLAAACANPLPAPADYLPAREPLLAAVRRTVDRLAQKKAGRCE
ncbi:MAG: beta-1,4-galactosyltransferase [Candidatus Hydrogenedentes bacterium]|nr:beta-1,4-galactosyltransferase [Candidatus Hydrogenedentota bacterium]